MTRPETGMPYMKPNPRAINLGCGTFPADGWVNVDVNPDLPGVDVRLPADMLLRGTALPWEDGSVDSVYAGHVLEHLTYDAELPAMLAEIHRILHPFGTLMVVGPDLDRAVEFGADAVTNIWPGAVTSDEPGAKHQWPSTVDATSIALVNAGFDGEEVPIADVPDVWPVVSRIGWQFAIQARKART